MENIKVWLGAAASNFTDEQITLAFELAKAEVEVYCHRKLDTELTLVAERIAVIKLQRLNTEGLIGASFSGVSENYLDGYPAEIVEVLNRRRKVKIL